MPGKMLTLNVITTDHIQVYLCCSSSIMQEQLPVVPAQLQAAAYNRDLTWKHNRFIYYPTTTVTQCVGHMKVEME
jgi:hypothetical protein